MAKGIGLDISNRNSIPDCRVSLLVLRLELPSYNSVQNRKWRFVMGKMSS